jgi:hypothetical protein
MGNAKSNHKENAKTINDYEIKLQECRTSAAVTKSTFVQRKKNETKQKYSRIVEK